MKQYYQVSSLVIVGCFFVISCFAWQQYSRFKVLVLFENGGYYIAYSTEAKKWLNQLTAYSNFTITYINNTDSFNDDFLQQYQLFIQLDYPPYCWKDKAAEAGLVFIMSHC